MAAVSIIGSPLTTRSGKTGRVEILARGHNLADGPPAVAELRRAFDVAVEACWFADRSRNADSEDVLVLAVHATVERERALDDGKAGADIVDGDAGFLV